MKTTIRYICGGCDYKWSHSFDCGIRLSTKISNAGRLIVVPANVSPCCGEGG